MKKSLLILALSLLLSSGISALEVNQSELTSAGDTTIEFINYTGPHKVIDSISAIRSIGSGLGNQIAVDPTKSANTNKNAR